MEIPKFENRSGIFALNAIYGSANQKLYCEWLNSVFSKSKISSYDKNQIYLVYQRLFG